MKTKNIICYGEVLWDLLPTGAVPGGAPMNVAIRAQSLGLSAKIISKIGNDKLGMDLSRFLKEKNVDISLLQVDEKLSTGSVFVEVDKNGIATYDIKYPTAWDKIELSNSIIENVKLADAFVFGSLSCRDDVSKQTLLSLIKHAKFKVFDVNLRPPFYDLKLIKELIQKSDLVKLNDEELVLLVNELGLNSLDLNESVLFLNKKLNVKTICVTRGEKGALLFANGEFFSHKGFKVKVADTVGSGDSFLAALIFKILSNDSYDETIEFACAIGSLVASLTGANSEITNEDIKNIIKNS